MPSFASRSVFALVVMMLPSLAGAAETGFRITRFVPHLVMRQPEPRDAIYRSPAGSVFACASQSSSPQWHTDYAEAMRQAKREQKLLLVLFHGSGRNSAREQLEAKINNDKKVQAKLPRYVLAKVPLNAMITVGGKPLKVSTHAAFAELKRREGFAIIDMTASPHHGQVVSAIPLVPGKYYRFRPQHVNVALSLPPGTLTQRSMIFAVRIHPEAPASAWGQKDPVLTSEAASHSKYQAQITNQGHHRWDHRFQRILGKLMGRRGGGYQRAAAPVEVVAESWPNQDLIDSCVDCVHSWRQSDGHWSAVKGRQASYGYDIRRGRNGIWYATGIFTR